MPDWLAAVLGFLRPGLKVYLTIAFTCGLVLFLPESVLRSLGLYYWRGTYSGVWGLGFVLFGALSLCHGVQWLMSTYAGDQTRASLRGFITARWVRREFDNLSVKERFLILVVVQSHESNFLYPAGGDTIQSLIDKGWVKYVKSGYTKGSKFRIRWDKWLALERFRAHVRSEWGRFSDDDKEELRNIRDVLKDVGLL